MKNPSQSSQEAVASAATRSCPSAANPETFFSTFHLAFRNSTHSTARRKGEITGAIASLGQRLLVWGFNSLAAVGHGVSFASRLRHLRKGRLAQGTAVLEIVVEGRAIEWNDDDLVVVRFVASIFLFRNVNDGEGESCQVTVLKVNARALHLVPVIDGPIGVTHEIGRGIVSQSSQFPIVDAVGRSQVVGLAGAPTVDHD